MRDLWVSFWRLWRISVREFGEERPELFWSCIDDGATWCCDDWVRLAFSGVDFYLVPPFLRRILRERLRDALRREVQLTKAQAAIVEWAIDPMCNYFCTESERGGYVFSDSVLPELKGCTLTISHVPEVNEYLLYRLECQQLEMREESAYAAEKIRQTISMPVSSSILKSL